MLSDIFIRTFIYEIIRSLYDDDNGTIQFCEQIAGFIDHTIDGYIGFDPLLKHRLNEYILGFYNMINAIRNQKPIDDLPCSKANFWLVSPMTEHIKFELIDHLIKSLSDKNFYILEKVITGILPTSMTE